MREEQTLNYYNEQAQAYCAQTYSVGFDDIYEKFIDLLPNIDQQTILDVGCGSGRDSVYFAEQRHFNVTAIDGSSELLALAKKSTNCQIDWHQMRFNDIADQDWESRFSGIWACASLLHAQFAELPDLLTALSQCLQPNGVMYLSFKYGDNERVDGKRFFCDLNEERLKVLLDKLPNMQAHETWLSGDKRQTEQNIWLNTLLKKTG